MWGMSRLKGDGLEEPMLTDLLSAITFLAQWHPLIVPERSDLRREIQSRGVF
jgi:hypothetical protein